MASISIMKQLKDTIRSKVNLVDIVNAHVVLRKVGSNYVGLCPFHSERTPSFQVSEMKQLFFCHGCKKGGDLFTFAMEISAIDFREALQDLSERANLTLPAAFSSRDRQINASTSGDFDQEDASGQESNLKETSLDERVGNLRIHRTFMATRLNRFIASFYHQKLHHLKSAENYLQNRGVSISLIKGFYLGGAGSQWDDLANYLKTSQSPFQLAVELGIVRTKSTGAIVGEIPAKQTRDFFDLFRNRIMFPIMNTRGTVVGFGGRIIPQENSGAEGQAKYLNSPESFLFQKQKVLFGLYQAQKFIREKNEAIVVEGYFDVLALNLAGVHNVVAACGTSLTHEHLLLLNRLCKKTIVLFDADTAGQNATLKAMEMALEKGIVLYEAVLPKKMIFGDGNSQIEKSQDPDEFILEAGSPKNAAEKISEILKDAKPILDARIQSEILISKNSPEALSQALKKIGGWLNRFKDPVGREARIQFLQMSGISGSLIKESIGFQGRRAPQIQEKQTLKAKEIKLGPNDKMMVATDRLILLGLLHGERNIELFMTAKNKLPVNSKEEDLFEFPLLRNFAKKLLNTKMVPAELPALLESCLENHLSEDNHNPDTGDSNTVTHLIEALMSEHTNFTAEEYDRILQKRVNLLWQRYSKQIIVELKEAEALQDSRKQTKLMKDYLDVQRKMKELNSFL